MRELKVKRLRLRELSRLCQVFHKRHKLMVVSSVIVDLCKDTHDHRQGGWAGLFTHLNTSSSQVLELVGPVGCCPGANTRMWSHWVITNDQDSNGVEEWCKMKSSSNNHETEEEGS